jgi:Tol biopolymer transport system component
VITGSPFNRQEGDPNGLYLVSPGGGALRPLAVGTTDLRGGGAWSPDGRQLVYWARVGEAEGLFVMDVGTRAERQLTSDWTDARGAWSPDGRWIAFSRRTSEHSDYPDHRHDDLWIVAADGGPEQVLLENGTVPKWMPTP